MERKARGWGAVRGAGRLRVLTRGPLAVTPRSHGGVEMSDMSSGGGGEEAARAARYPCMKIPSGEVVVVAMWAVVGDRVVLAKRLQCASEW